MVDAFRRLSGTVSDVLNHVADSLRLVFTPKLMLAIHYGLLLETPRWRLYRRWQINKRIKELEIVTGVYEDREAMRDYVRQLKRRS